jgi:hypothetical protein
VRILARDRVAVAAVALACAMAGCLGTPEEFEGTGVINFENRTTSSFVELRVTACGGTNYGENRMAGLEEIPPGREFRLRISPGCYDARINFANGAVVERAGIRVAEDQTTTVRIETLPGS